MARGILYRMRMRLLGSIVALSAIVAACGEDGVNLGGASQGADASGVDASTEDGGSVPGSFGSPRLLSELEDLIDPTSQNDDPSFTEDRLELYFESNRAGGAGSTDLYVSTRTSTAEPWGSPRALVELNTPTRDSGPGISPDGLTLWFASARPGGQGEQDIWVTSRPSRSSNWDTPVLVAELNSPEGDQLPSVSDDGLTIHFSSARAGGAGGFDIYVARRTDVRSAWSAPQPLTELNTEFDDTRPLLRSDGLELYFSGVGSAPASSVDLLFASRGRTTDRFGIPSPLTGVNTGAIEEDGWISSDLRYLVFVSDRSGALELYEAIR